MKRLARVALHPLVSTTDERRAERSRLLWGTRPGHPGVYVLSSLGLLNSVRGWLRLPPVQIRDPYGWPA